MRKRKIISVILTAVLTAGAISFFPNSYLGSMTVKAVSSATPDITEEAKSAVTKFFTAQKAGDVDEMIKHSKYVLQISNLKEFYTQICKAWSLQSATITDIKAINDTFALVSYETKYKDRILISTAPVYKENGRWKLVTGIPPASYIQTKSIDNEDKPAQEAKQAIMNYFKAEKTGNIKKMIKYYKNTYFDNEDATRKFLFARQKNPLVKGEVLGITVVGDDLVLATIKSKYPFVTSIEAVPVYKDAGEWKIVFGPKLVKEAILISTHPVHIE